MQYLLGSKCCSHQNTMNVHKDINWFKQEIEPQLSGYDVNYRYFEQGDFGSLSQVGFEGKDNSSALHILQENFENEEAMQPHREGWDKGLADLQSFLEGGSSSANGASDSSRDASAGYGESPEQQKVGGG